LRVVRILFQNSREMATNFYGDREMKQQNWRAVWSLAGVVALLVGCSSTPSSSSGSAEVERARAFCAQPAQIPNLSASIALATGYFAIGDNNLSCAEAALSQARRLEPRNAYVALNLGVLCQKTGRTALARAAYQDAIEFDRATTSDPAVIATKTDAVNSTPGLIARRNLTNLR
jgi:tetratricopeptide (TPR) repeat protein